ncbi:MAG TPA: AAA family ATPase [Thermomicrobiales bacterium]|nr:AAA family ATPase [Thermomicrobiales bacterium]
MTHNGHDTEDAAKTAPYLRAFSLSELAAFEFPPIRWLVEDLIPAGALVLIVGRPKAGKSLLTIDLGASVALGETFLGRATSAGPVALVPAEDALVLVRSRLFTRLDRERAAPVYVIPADGSIDQRVALDDETSFRQLAATVELLKPSLVVLDPLRELHHRKENDADEMAALLRPVRQLAHESGTTIIMVHHRNKHAQDPSLATRGSSAITGGVDVVVTIEADTEKDADGLTPDTTLTLHVEGRYGPRRSLAARLGPGLRWQVGEFAADDDLSAADRIRRHLEVTGDELTAEGVVEAVGLPLRTVQNNLPALYRAGHLRRLGAGTKADPYRYRAALASQRGPLGEDSAGAQHQEGPIAPEPERDTRAAGGIAGAPGARERVRV